MTNKSKKAPKLIRDLMTVGVFTCPPKTLVVDLVREMLKRELEAAVVQDAEGQAIGVVTLSELINAYSKGAYKNTTADEIMRPGLPQLPPDIPVSVAAQIMQDEGVRVIFLMHNAGGISYPAALITFAHILRHMAMETEEDIDDLGIQAKRQAPLDVFLERREQARRKNLSTLMDDK